MAADLELAEDIEDNIPPIWQDSVHDSDTLIMFMDVLDKAIDMERKEGMYALGNELLSMRTNGYSRIYRWAMQQKCGRYTSFR